MAFESYRPRSLTLVQSFASRWRPWRPRYPTTTTFADFWRRIATSGFHSRGQTSPGKNALLHCTTARFTPSDPWSQKLLGFMPARLGQQRLLSGSCSIHRLTIYDPRLLPTLGHPHAVALRFARFDQLAGGLAPPGVRPCWANTKKNRQNRL
jgi:hypothetical protein